MNSVAIVGAGPVGLYLACLLADSGRGVSVLERRGAPAEAARSIGVHPPALEALDRVGVAGCLIERGALIRSARVTVGPRYLGSVSLDSCPPPYPFVLSLDQAETERVLEARLERLAPGALCRNVEVAAANVSADGAILELAGGGSLEAAFVVGCDGRRSRVRESLSVPVLGRAHGDHYLMADVPDATGPAGDALLCLDREGVVESFPLPGGRRRWVARVRRRPALPGWDQLAEVVAGRTGQDPVDARAPVAAFTAETRIASSFAGTNWALAGDAAHVVSPIGGQGMNLGLLGAMELSRALLAREPELALARYGRLQARRARRAARRARLNMVMGHERMPPALRAAILRGLLVPGLERPVARYFTMRGL